MFDDDSPIYRQIAGRITADVLNGVLGPDEQVMSTNQYAAFYRINPATAAKAFQRLVEEGVLYKKRGVGMFVSPGARDRLRADRRARFFADRVDPLVDEARTLGIPLAEVLDRIRQRAEEAAVRDKGQAQDQDQDKDVDHDQNHGQKREPTREQEPVQGRELARGQQQARGLRQDQAPEGRR